MPGEEGRGEFQHRRAGEGADGVLGSRELTENSDAAVRAAEILRNH